MPLYEYQCQACSHVTECIRGVSERDRPAFCERCGDTAYKIVSLPAWTPARWGDSHGEFIPALGGHIPNRQAEERAMKERGLCRIDDLGNDWLDNAIDNARNEHQEFLNVNDLD